MKKNKGFTLIEILVVIALLGIVVALGTNLFFSILKGASKAEITKEVKQNGDYAMETMARMIRNAQTVLPNSETPSRTCVSSMAKIKIRNPDGGETEFGCATEENVTKIASGSARLTGANVTLGTSCPGTLSFSCESTRPPKVTIFFTLYQRGVGRPEEQAQVPFQTTVSLRTY